MTTLRIGIANYQAYKARTMAIARGEIVEGPQSPKVWFPSIESLAKVLSDRNRDLLSVVAQSQPQSLSDLAQATGRAKSNLSRTLRNLEFYGIIALDAGPNRTLVPRILYDEICVDLPLTSEPPKIAA